MAYHRQYRRPNFPVFRTLPYQYRYQCEPLILAPFVRGLVCCPDNTNSRLEVFLKVIMRLSPEESAEQPAPGATPRRQTRRTLHPTSYTLHPTPKTPKHPKHQTRCLGFGGMAPVAGFWHPEPRTLNPEPCTPHPKHPAPGFRV